MLWETYENEIFIFAAYYLNALIHVKNNKAQKGTGHKSSR